VRSASVQGSSYLVLILINVPALCLSAFQALAALTIGAGGLGWLDLFVRPMMIAVFLAIAGGLAMARAEHVAGNSTKACRMLAIQFVITSAAYGAFFLLVAS
jgi:hypothetical protein